MNTNYYQFVTCRIQPVAMNALISINNRCARYSNTVLGFLNTGSFGIGNADGINHLRIPLSWVQRYILINRLSGQCYESIYSIPSAVLNTGLPVRRYDDSFMQCEDGLLLVPRKLWSQVIISRKSFNNIWRCVGGSWNEREAGEYRWRRTVKFEVDVKESEDIAG